MRGQYAHNTGVWTNETAPAEAGRVQESTATKKTTWPRACSGAGYRTGLFGKYLNGYEKTTSVPPGWDDWFAMQPPAYFDYRVNDNGTIKHYGSDPSDYSTDVLKGQTEQFINASVSTRKPFFAYVAPAAPHEPSTPAPRDRHTFDGIEGPAPSLFQRERRLR